MKLVGASYKLELAQYMELQAFSQFASDLGEETKYRLSRGVKLVQLLKQTNGAPMTLGKQITLLSIANQDLISGIPQDKIEQLKGFIKSIPNWVSMYVSVRLISTGISKVLV
jgi:F-type H+-transporting ATPase subunit alpha